jgi:hypothetical protein
MSVIHWPEVETTYIIAISIYIGDLLSNYFKIFIFMFPSSIRKYLWNNVMIDTQRHPTTPNDTQRHPTTPNDTQRHSTTPNAIQRHPTTPNAIQRQWCNPMTDGAAYRDDNNVIRRQMALFELHELLVDLVSAHSNTSRVESSRGTNEICQVGK